MARIIIAGDSWGCGEWDFDPIETGHIITHKGIEQYFLDDGYAVVNLCKGGASNNFAINSLRNYPNITDGDIILWFQTDPLRDLQPYDGFHEEFTNYDTIITAQEKLLEQTYTNLDSIGYKIICIGGCSKLRIRPQNPYYNLIPILASFAEFAFVEYVHPEVWFSDWYYLVDRQFDLDSLDKLLYNKELQDQLRLPKNQNWVSPDGQHPNRIAHRKLYEFLLSHETIFKRTT